MVVFPGVHYQTWSAKLFLEKLTSSPDPERQFCFHPLAGAGPFHLSPVFVAFSFVYAAPPSLRLTVLKGKGRLECRAHSLMEETNDLLCQVENWLMIRHFAMLPVQVRMWGFHHDFLLPLSFCAHHLALIRNWQDLS